MIDMRKKIDDLERELKETYRGLEQLNNIIHEAIIELENYEYDGEANRYAPIRETLDILRGKIIPPEEIGTNGEDGGLFDYGDR